MKSDRRIYVFYLCVTEHIFHYLICVFCKTRQRVSEFILLYSSTRDLINRRIFIRPSRFANANFAPGVRATRRKNARTTRRRPRRPSAPFLFRHSAGNITLYRTGTRIIVAENYHCTRIKPPLEYWQSLSATHKRAIAAFSTFPITGDKISNSHFHNKRRAESEI